MVNFQLSKLNVKDEMINNDMSVGQRNKSESPTGIEPMTSRAGALSTELQELIESEAI